MRLIVNKKQAIIVDLDGTLSDCQHRRHFIDGTHNKQDWRSFYESMVTECGAKTGLFVYIAPMEIFKQQTA